MGKQLMHSNNVFFFFVLNDKNMSLLDDQQNSFGFVKTFEMVHK